MKTLFLVRHAKSSWDDMNLADFDRPLASRGFRDAPEMGRRLASRNIIPDLILSSPANRAFSTATIIARSIDYDLDKIETRQDIYLAGVRTLVNQIQSVSDRVYKLMLFGHNPGFTDLANYLSGSNILNIPTAGIVCIEFNVDKWSVVEKNSGRLNFFDYPKNQGSNI
ncbi:MAG: histidine phosphatase family protein [Cyclobacteriaceae bacterium]|nr:histidine phosphatase family protein [Cyclobacteriaceae bacterium]